MIGLALPSKLRQPGTSSLSMSANAQEIPENFTRVVPDICQDGLHMLKEGPDRSHEIIAVVMQKSRFRSNDLSQVGSTRMVSGK